MTTDIKHETKQNASHTLGPWSYVTMAYESHREILSADGLPIAKVEAWDGEGSEDALEAEANARLIAAAPRMLASLEQIIEILPLGNQPWEANSQEALARNTAIAAIAEATGRAV